ncbi:MAG TPA: hypothetical protein VL359_02090 [bacterium]|nr:hypothetical protein [bacterium]
MSAVTSMGRKSSGALPGSSPAPGSAPATGAVPAALGLVVHTGWAHAVAVAWRGNALLVLQTGRIALWEPPDAAAAQAYHRAAGLSLPAAQRALAADEKTARRVTAQSLRSLQEELAGRGYPLTAIRVVDKARRPLPALPQVLGSHPLLHAAEGAFFRAVVLAEAGRLTRDAAQLDGSALPGAVARAARLTPQALAGHLARAGKLAGAPWGQEQRRCALAAWLALLLHAAEI